MMRFENLAILLMGLMVVIAGPVPKNCTVTTESNGDITEICRDQVDGVVLTADDGRKLVIRDSINDIELSEYLKQGIFPCIVKKKLTNYHFPNNFMDNFICQIITKQ